MEGASDTDSGDEQLKLAIALSVQDQSAAAPPPRGKLVRDTVDLTEDLTDAGAQESALKPILTSHGVLGLDRKAMEEERLARKRKAPISPSLRAKVQKTSDNSRQQVKDHQRDVPTGVAATINDEPAHKVMANRKTKTVTSEPLNLRFASATVKKTWAFGFPRSEEDIKMEEVLERQDLTLAVLSSFQWDVEWLLGKIDTANTKLIMVMQAKDESTKRQYARETNDMPNLRLCFPSMEGQVNCMHSKLMLLAHPTYLRIAVPTANLVPYDWGESGVMENTVFLVDLPRCPKGHTTVLDDLTFFGKELVYFCQAMGLQTDVVNSIYDFDFSATKDLAFVHTIGGAHTGETEPWRRTGYCGLGRAVQHLGLSTVQPLSIDFIASSIGAVNTDFFIMLYLAAQGNDGLREYNWRIATATKAARKRDHSWRDEIIENIVNSFRLYFPSQDTVLRSRGGVECGGPICFQSRWYNSSTILQHILRDCQSTRKGLLTHNKILYVRQHPHVGPEGSSQNCSAWAYVGSANCSESAWGKLVPDRGTKAPKLNCRNWECGVIMPVRKPSLSAGSDGSTLLENGLTVFQGIVPVPIQYPGAEMKSRQPWYNAEQPDESV